MLRYFLLFLAAFAWADVPTARHQDLAAYRARAHGEFVQRLEEYSKWCGKNLLGEEFVRALTIVLELDPDNKFARKKLGYKDSGDGWKPPRKPVSRRNRNEQALEECAARYAAVLDPLIDGHIALIRSGRLTAQQRDELLIEIVRYDPDNEFVANASLEIRAAAVGILPESLRGRERREQMLAWYAEAFESVPPVRLREPTAEDRALGPFLGVAETPLLRILFTTKAEEAEQLVRDLHALDSFFRSVFPDKRGLGKGITVYLLDGDRDKHRFLANHPLIGVDAAYRQQLENLSGSGIRNTHDIATWDLTPEERRDGVIRIALGRLVSTAFRVQAEQGWAYEGIGIYLARWITGTRLTWMASSGDDHDPAEFALRERLCLPDTNWINEYYGLYYDRQTPDFSRLLVKKAEELSVEELLTSYVLAAYLIEGAPEKIPTFLGLARRYDLSAEVKTRKVFDLEPAELMERIGRWVTEIQ